MRFTGKGRFGALFCLLLVPAIAQAQRPCEAETAALMTQKSSWEDMHRAARVLPPHCFDGHFAEGISETIVRKMREDWPGFLVLMAKHPRQDAFFELVLRSINPTLDTADLKELDALAHKSCPAAQRARCDAIAREAAAALKDAN